MFIEIDFDSDEAYYIQLQNQIIMGIATDLLHEGDQLPSVRQMAELIGINMHTVNKAYAMLREDGFLILDRHKGSVIAVDMDKARSFMELKENMKKVLARASCRNISRDEVHEIVDLIFDEYRYDK